MNQNEQTRLKVLNSVMVGQLPVAQAAELLGVSERHVWRVLAAYRREGAAALVHGNRGRRPANATSEAAIADVLRLATTRYSGTNHTHLSELLMEREGIALSRSTVRRIALSAGVTSPRRRRSPRHRVRRKRMPQAGMLVQIDGSHYRWLEGRGPSFALLLAVDDATSTAPYALFQAGRGRARIPDADGGTDPSATVYRWPSTATDTPFSSMPASLGRSCRDRRSLPVRWSSWAYDRYSRDRHKPRGVSSGPRGRSRIDSSLNCA